MFLILHRILNLLFLAKLFIIFAIFKFAPRFGYFLFFPRTVVYLVNLVIIGIII